MEIDTRLWGGSDLKAAVHYKGDRHKEHVNGEPNPSL